MKRHTLSLLVTQIARYETRYVWRVRAALGSEHFNYLCHASTFTTTRMIKAAVISFDLLPFPYFFLSFYTLSIRLQLSITLLLNPPIRPTRVYPQTVEQTSKSDICPLFNSKISNFQKRMCTFELGVYPCGQHSKGYHVVMFCAIFLQQIEEAQRQGLPRPRMCGCRYDSVNSNCRATVMIDEDCLECEPVKRIKDKKRKHKHHREDDGHEDRQRGYEDRRNSYA